MGNIKANRYSKDSFGLAVLWTNMSDVSLFLEELFEPFEKSASPRGRSDTFILTIDDY